MIWCISAQSYFCFFYGLITCKLTKPAEIPLINSNYKWKLHKQIYCISVANICLWVQKYTNTYINIYLCVCVCEILLLILQRWIVLLSWRRSVFAASSLEIFHNILLWCRGLSRNLIIWVLMEGYFLAVLFPWSRPHSPQELSPRRSVLACRYSRTPNAHLSLVCMMTVHWFVSLPYHSF